MAEQLIGFGFWRSLHEPLLPDPAWFIDEQWSAVERNKVLKYLGQGRRLHHWMGFSWCRFRCEENDMDMGTCDLTDGTYCWPEGLTHYITEHHVRLPVEIVRHIISQPKFPSTKATQAVEGIEADNTWWQQQ